ncbi:hypothetical protein [Coprobacter fastidiosus]|uniref:hypothetical protein n=1 Tax=Coprobacter fastidiosus TaxID=1099853 RepID=UPI00320B6864
MFGSNLKVSFKGILWFLRRWWWATRQMKMGKKTGRRRKNDLITFSYRRIKTGSEYDFDLFVEGKSRPTFYDFL